ncbi:hypothetical protein [Deinococcus cellulosilyticus]|uniref:Uncharacterized protein n=1 Tax=Deinococcus cellulosilyticus (strain DSM 18568 / NBRC 106333 / KACC 11606 / 5516J-15) TaxID=1223518 RepID=A0A511NC01_DEIC1|nr:hypothetical protein [Deinococcus cellulosilyticus]GEM50028.1 hypothetical protein DC3_56630 [Deinococcus cellulosilyticus NBRC 106333 = KACC 11606]
MGKQINGKFYDWGDVTVNLPHGTMLDGEEINYSDEMGVNRSQGKGLGTRGYGRSQYKSGGDITLKREEYNRLEKAAEGGIYSMKPFPITVSYVNEDGETVTDTLEHCIFKKRDFKAGEKSDFMTVKLDFEILGQILTNGKPAYKE